MNQRAEIVASIQKASTLAEQAALVSQLDAFDREQQARVSRVSALDLTDTIVRETLSPVAVHERSSIETDWLGQVEASHEDYANEISAEAALWFGRTSPEVKADQDEFAEQARGMARRTAGKYGEQAEAAEAQFLDYVSFLRTQAASGLPQVEQLVDSFENPAQQQLPTETFDNFAPEVHPLNQGVSGTETSERAPLIQEIERNNGSAPSDADPSHHDETQQFEGPEPVQARPGPQGTTSSLFSPSLALSHVGNLDDFKAEFAREAAEQERKEAASGLPQVQQTVDSFENPAPQPLPTEVAYPWELEEGESEEERSDKKAAFQRRAAYVAGLMQQPFESLNEVERKEVRAFTAVLRKRADQWTEGAPQSTTTPIPNNSGTTPEPPYGTYEQGKAEGRSDWPLEQPTYADNSSSAPPFVRGHSEGYQEASHEDQGAPPGRMPPGARAAARSDVSCKSCGNTGRPQDMVQRGNGHSIDYTCRTCKPATNPANTKTDYERTASQQKTAAETVHLEHPSFSGPSCGSDAPSGAKTTRKLSEVNCSGCSSRIQEATEFQQSQPKGMYGHAWSDSPKGFTSSLRVSASFTSPMESADPQFAKGYKFATKWTPAKPLVRQGSVSFEAGLYAGISDNTEHQEAWVDRHQKAAKQYRDKAFLRRLSLHRSFSKKAVKHLDGLQVHGCYLRPVEEKVEKTAGTLTDLDTVAPSASPSPTGETPINGPGHTPPLQGGTDPARPGGPSPYNGVEPYGQPAVPNGTGVHGVPTAIDTTPGGPVDQAAFQHLSPQTQAFRKRVQANLLKSRQEG